MAARWRASSFPPICPHIPQSHQLGNCASRAQLPRHNRRSPQCCVQRSTVVTKRSLSTLTHPATGSGVTGGLPDFFVGIDGSIQPSTLGPGSWQSTELGNSIRRDSSKFNAYIEEKSNQLKALRTLSSPWLQPCYKSKKKYVKATAVKHTSLMVLPEANAALIPHAIFRAQLRSPNLTEKIIRKTFRLQLLRCLQPREVLRIVAVAFQRDRLAQALAMLEEPLIRSMYRCRTQASDPEIFTCLNAIIMRFRSAKLRIAPDLMYLAIKFAARSRSLASMKKLLSRFRAWGLHINSHLFRAIIAKCSIGSRGLGEIRNGRWRRSDLLQVLRGFDDCRHLPPGQQYHLETFLDRSDWQFLHGWVAVLARCRDSNGVWAEWLLWKESAHRKRFRPPADMVAKAKSDDYVYQWPLNGRGDVWFLEQMVTSGDGRLSWSLLADAGISFALLRTHVKDMLLEHLEFCPPDLWSSLGLREELLAKYERDLLAIEKAFGIKWHAYNTEPSTECPVDESVGYHEQLDDTEVMLERLSTAHEIQREDDHGYPWEDGSTS